MTKKIKARKIVKYYYVEEEKVDKKKVWYLLLLLLFTGLLLSTSTYAWFTTNRVVSVNTLNVKVQAEGSLEISVDGIGWKASIDQEAITSAHGTTYPTSTNQLPAYIEPVSTIGSLDGTGFMQMFLGNVISSDEGEYILTSTKSIETESNGETSEGKFIAFDIFLKTTESKDLYLTNESKITYGGTTSTGTENAVRVAFIIEGNTNTGDSIGNIQALRTTNTDDVYIWEPNYDTHTKTGISNARDVYGIITTETGGTRIAYDGVMAEVKTEDNITLGKANATNYPNLFSPVTPKITTTNGSTAYQNLFTLQAGITKVRVYMWLEGQDVDCENNASVGDLTFDLQFSTNPA